MSESYLKHEVISGILNLINNSNLDNFGIVYDRNHYIREKNLKRKIFLR